MDGLMDGLMDGWMDGWIDGWIDGWPLRTEGAFFYCVFQFTERFYWTVR